MRASTFDSEVETDIFFSTNIEISDDPHSFNFFLPFFLLQKIYIVFYPSYVSICKDLQKTIILSSGPFLQVFTSTVQCICNL